jgi:hypothetical protein
MRTAEDCAEAFMYWIDGVMNKILNDAIVVGLGTIGLTALWSLYKVIAGLVGWNAAY